MCIPQTGNVTYPVHFLEFPCPGNLRFLPMHDSITFDLNYLNKSKDNLGNMNVYIIVQCLLSELSRTEIAR